MTSCKSAATRRQSAQASKSVKIKISGHLISLQSAPWLSVWYREDCLHLGVFACPNQGFSKPLIVSRACCALHKLRSARGLLLGQLLSKLMQPCLTTQAGVPGCLMFKGRGGP